MRKDFPFAGCDPPRIDRDNDALTAEFFCSGTNQLWIGQRGRIDADFVRAGVKHRAHISDRANSSANRERHKTLVCRPFDYVNDRSAAVGACGNIEKDHFIGALVIITNRQLYRVAHVAEFSGFGFPELNATSDVAAVNIQAWYDSAC
jgi:hypothetical protein